MDNKLISKIKTIIETGEFDKAYRIIEPYLLDGDAVAEFLYSSFSVGETETAEEFEARSLQLIQSAASKGLPDALYVLGAIYDTGDGVRRDPIQASRLLKQAAEAGYPRAMLSHGLDLYYGSNEIERNQKLGVAFIERASILGVNDADVVLGKIKYCE